MSEEDDLLRRLPVTIDEVRRLNRDTLLSWPLPMLGALASVRCALGYLHSRTTVRRARGVEGKATP